jgi:TP901 family phage tail tape measure protein
MASAGGIRMGKVFVEIGADSAKFFAEVNRINKRIGQIGASMSKFGTQMMGMGALIGAPVGLAVRQFAKFDDAIRATAAVTGSLGPQGAAAFAMLNDKARELGATTSFTAVEVANLMTELGRAGFKPDEINAMTGAVLDLARATGTDATRSAGIMAATLRQFGLGAEEAARAADVLTYTANNTFNTVDSLGESLKYAGPVAKSLGMSLEDTAAILGVLGNVGIQGSEAGTALRRLSVISAGTGEKLNKLFGIDNMDAAGNLKPLVQILDEINTATTSMPVAERTAKMAQAFGLLGITSANVLSQTAGGVRNLRAGLDTAAGTANNTAKAMDAGLGGALRIMLSAVEGTALAIGDALAPSLMKAVNFMERASTAATAFVKANSDVVLSVAAGVFGFTALGGAIFVAGKALAFLSGVVGVLLSPFGALVAAIGVVAIQSGLAQGAIGDLSATAQSVGSQIAEALAAGDFAKAWIYAVAAVEEALLRMRATFDKTIQRPISLAAVQAAYAPRYSSLLDRIDPQGERDKFAGMQSEDARRRLGIAQSLASATDQQSFDAAKVTASQEAALQDRLGNKDIAAALREMTSDIRANLIQVGAISDGTFEASLATIKANAETKVAELAAKRAVSDQAEAFVGQARDAKTLDELRSIADEFFTLKSMGGVSPEQEKRYMDAVDQASEKLTPTATGSAPQGPPQPKVESPEDRARRLEEERLALEDSISRQSEAIGTFSADAASGMGFGGTVFQEQLKELKAIRKELEEEIQDEVLA